MQETRLLDRVLAQVGVDRSRDVVLETAAVLGVGKGPDRRYAEDVA